MTARHAGRFGLSERAGSAKYEKDIPFPRKTSELTRKTDVRARKTVGNLAKMQLQIKLKKMLIMREAKRDDSSLFFIPAKKAYPSLASLMHFIVLSQLYGF